MASLVDLCNQALSHLGIATEIQDLDGERSAEAKACRRFTDPLTAQLFRDFPWPFATTIAALALVEEQPNDEWAYAYRYPAGCVAFRRILVGGAGRTAPAVLRVPFRLIRDDAGTLVLTDAADAVAEWTVRVDDPEQWPADTAAAFAFLLAGTIAPRLTAGDQHKLGARALGLYQYQLQHAAANATYEEAADLPPDSEFIRGRA